MKKSRNIMTTIKVSPVLMYVTALQETWYFNPLMSNASKS